LMVPDAATIARRRHLLRTIVRCTALVLLIMFVGPVLSAVLVSVLEGATFGPRFFVRVAASAGPVLAAVALLAFERRLVMWLVPMGSHRCPQCDYFLVSLVEPRCPECGLPLTREFLDAGAGQGSGAAAGGVGRRG
jgi:hypothetical protein